MGRVMKPANLGTDEISPYFVAETCGDRFGSSFIICSTLHLSQNVFPCHVPAMNNSDEFMSARGAQAHAQKEITHS